MFVGRRKLITIINNVVKSKIHTPLRESRCGAVIGTPNFYISTAYFSNEIKRSEPINIDIGRPVLIKTPLTSIINKDVEIKKEVFEEAAAEEEEATRTRESSWRTMKITLIIFGFSMTCLSVYLVLELGKPRLDKNGIEIEDEFTHMSKVKQYVLRSLQAMVFYIKLFEEPSRDKLLPDLTPLYQPPYTLVLELTDVLVHPDWTYQTGWRFKKRPGVQRFLESLASRYEIVIYTAEQGMTVFPIIDAIDPNGVISYKLVRDATHFYGGHHVKSLKNLNRDLSKVIVVDWNSKSVKFNPENLLQVPRWEGHDNDDLLSDLAAMLHAIADANVEDIRPVCKNFSKFENPPLEFRNRQKKLVDQLEKEKLEELERHPPRHRWYHTFWQGNPAR